MQCVLGTNQGLFGRNSILHAECSKEAEGIIYRIDIFSEKNKTIDDFSLSIAPVNV